MIESRPSLLEMKGMYKSFGGVHAVQDVDLVLYPQEILGLVGDNAAGKSTLTKLLTAVHKPDAGSIYINGVNVKIKKPLDARHLGIEMIYQDFSLATNLNISDNVFLGREETINFLGLKILNRMKMDQVVREAMKETNIRVDSIRATVSKLSGGQMQAVAIARATAFNANIIIMDEPTASLSVKTIPEFLKLVKRLRNAGKSMIFITHRLADIFSVCDRVMVLRRGENVGDIPIHKTNMNEVIGLINGSRESFISTKPDSLVINNEVN